MATTGPTTLSARRTTVRRRIGMWCRVGAGVGLVIFIAVWALLPGAKNKVIWNPAMASKPGAEFAYLVFPSSDALPVFSSHDSAPTVTVDRAIAIPQWELDAARSSTAAVGTSLCKYALPGGDGFISLGELRLLPPLGTKIDYVGNYVRMRRAKEPVQFVGANFEVSPGADGSSSVTYTVHLDDYTESYRYTVDAGGNGHPAEFTELNGMEVGFRAFANIMISGAAAVLVTPVVLLVLRLTLLRPRAAPAFTPPRTT